jgi:hypothetical protein
MLMESKIENQKLKIMLRAKSISSHFSTSATLFFYTVRKLRLSENMFFAPSES